MRRFPEAGRFTGPRTRRRKGCIVGGFDVRAERCELLVPLCLHLVHPGSGLDQPFITQREDAAACVVGVATVGDQTGRLKGPKVATHDGR